MHLLHIILKLCFRIKEIHIISQIMCQFWVLLQSVSCRSSLCQVFSHDGWFRMAHLWSSYWLGTPFHSSSVSPSINKLNKVGCETWKVQRDAERKHKIFLHNSSRNTCSEVSTFNNNLIHFMSLALLDL